MPPKCNNPVGRFWSKVLKSDGCWEWSGALTNGYGRFQPGRHRAPECRAHRFSYALANGMSVESLGDRMICHHCDNRKCVRPDHLFLGTNSDNVKDAVAKGRWRNQCISRTQCSRGHPYTPENTRIYKGGRVCRACHSKPFRKWRKAEKATAA